MGRAEASTHRISKQEKTPTDMPIMRVAIAGTGGLARLIAERIEEDTSHHVILLSRSVRTLSLLYP